MTALSRLAEQLEPVEAERLADALAAGYRPALLMDHIRADRRAILGPLIQQAVAQCNDRALLSSVLDALAVAGRRARQQVDLVWSGVAALSSTGRTTSALADELIDSARDRIYVTTYSGDRQSPYVQALRRALDREIQVTAIIDTLGRTKVYAKLQPFLIGARWWTLVRSPARKYRAQHSKIVLVDERAALVTSANLSGAAAERNLECGILLEDSEQIVAMYRHLEGLHDARHLIDVP